MTKARFEIAFEGDPFDNGEIDVRDLAPTLLAFGTLIQSANRALNGDRADARLSVSSTERGSFVAALVTDVSWLTDMLDAVTANPDRVVAANQLMDLLIKGGMIIGGGATGAVGLLVAVKKLRGRRPERVEPIGDGMTRITVGETTLIVMNPVVTLLKDLPTREALEEIGTRASKVEGLRSLRIGQDSEGTEPVRFDRSDLPSLRVPPEPDEPDTQVSYREAWLRIVSVHFRDGYKWRFSDGGERPFTAEMEDTDFRNRVQDGQMALNANDAIRCRIREEQSLSATALLKTLFIEEVLEHRPGSRQLTLM
jgi:hypothetical protein